MIKRFEDFFHEFLKREREKDLQKKVTKEPKKKHVDNRTFLFLKISEKNFFLAPFFWWFFIFGSFFT